MRDFSEAGKKKKRQRIQIPPNPANLSPEQMSRLESTVKSKLKEGNLPCGIAWKIAQEAGIPRIAVGEITDRLGIRITDCQIGCFKVDKNQYDKALENIDENIVKLLLGLREKDELTCAAMHELAARLKLTPMALSDIANARDIKVRNCQLGCF
jgi:hypothetical protein